MELQISYCVNSLNLPVLDWLSHYWHIVISCDMVVCKTADSNISWICGTGVLHNNTIDYVRDKML